MKKQVHHIPFSAIAYCCLQLAPAVLRTTTKSREVSRTTKGNRFPEPDCSIRTHTVGYLLQYRFCWLKLGMADDTIPEP